MRSAIRLLLQSRQFGNFFPHIRDPGFSNAMSSSVTLKRLI